MDEVFDTVICMGNSFAFFNREEAVKILKNISLHLKKDGVLIINSWMIAEIAIRHFKQHDWFQVGEYKYLLDYQWRFDPGRIESEHTLLRNDGAVEVIRGVDYVFTLDDLEQMFREAGLTTIGLYSTPRKKKFTMGDGKIYVVAGKSNG
jgi:SAM-dependent methyltransferase